MGIGVIMAKTSNEDLFRRYRDLGDLAALGRLFDRLAPALGRVARRLHPQSPEDLVQETFLTAIDARARWDGRRPVGPWLVGILANHAHQARRESGRRPEVDRLPEVEVLEPSRSLEAHELRGQIQGALAGLPESLRQVVEQCLVHGRKPSQVAVELGIAPGTARQRLWRGLGELRGQLKGALGVLAGVFALHGKARAAVLQAGASATGAGSVPGVMGKGGWLGLALLVVVFGGSAALWALRDPGPDSDHPANAGLRAAVQEAAPEATPEVGPASFREVAAAPDELVFWPVHAVSESSGEDLEGIHLEMKSRTVLGNWLSHSAVTDVGGMARFELESDRAPFFLDAMGTEYSPGVRVGASEFVRGELTKVRIPDGWTLSGIVLDQEDRPVADAELLIWTGVRFGEEPDRILHSNALGQFSVDHLGGHFLVVPKKAGQVCGRGLIGGLSKDSDGHELRLVPPAKLGGHVIDPDGMPYKGAILEITSPTIPSNYPETHDPQVNYIQRVGEKAVSGEDGGFEFLLQPEGEVSLSCESPPYFTERYWHSIRGPKAVVQLLRGQTLPGVVVDSAGKPIEGAQLFTWPRPAAGCSDRKTTDRNGAFCFEGLKPENPEEFSDTRYRGILAWAPGFALQAVQPLPESGEVRIKLAPEERLRGRIVDRDGKPVSGIRVEVEGDRLVERNYVGASPHTLERTANMDCAVSNKDGCFSFSSLYPARFQVRAFAPGSSTQFIEAFAQSGGPDLEIVWDKQTLLGVQVQPVVVDALSGEPIRGFTLQRCQGDDGFGVPPVPGSDPLRFEGIQPGRFHFSVSAEGYERVDCAEVDHPAGEEPLKVALRPLRSLQVRVHFPNGQAPSVVDVEGRMSDGVMVMFRKRRWSTSSRATLLSDTGWLRGIPAGQVDLNFECQDYVGHLRIDLTQPPISRWTYS
ncbi:MAG: sigma-70 family RNA polymerase sigma factor [Planctomycetota bacterium]